MALIGLLQNNIAAVVGAMIIAPFLGPNLAFAFGTSQGDKALIAKAFTAGIVGLFLVLLRSAIVGFFWHELPYSTALMDRTTVGLSGVVLAVASGV